jgi:single-strand DNA-binding protein
MLRISTIGRLGQDAVVNTVNGKNVINFSVAYSEKFKNQQGEDSEKTTWVSCAYWTEKLNIANYLKKGTLVYVEGKPEAKSYQNKTNEVIPQLHCRISLVQLLSSNNKEEAPF